MTHRVRNVSGILGGALAGTLVASMLTLAPSAVATPLAGRSASSGPLPTLTQVPPGSGSHGYPYDAVPTTPTFPGAPTINLSSYGYAESEFTMSGTTNIYRQSDFWSSNGRWGVSVAQSSVPYTTRLLVRYPTDPSKFNGTVVVEWLNDTTGGDQDPVWSEIYNEALSQGYAYIGVTAQAAGMVELKTWDSQRYGALGDSNDGQSYDIFSQAAEVARADSATLLGGLSPARVIGAGDSQSAFRVDTYVNAIQPVSHAFDGFLAIGRSVFAAPIGSGLIAFWPAPAYVRTDNTTPFIQLNTEGDQREQPQVTAPQCVSGVPFNGATLPDNQPVYELEDAALAALDKWLVSGVQPAHGNPIATTPLLNLVQRDRYGNALGGIRMPDIQAPAETYTAINFYLPSQASLSPGQLLSTLVSIFTALQTGAITNTTLRNEGLCLLEGYYTPLGSTTLKALYPTHSDYVSAFTSAAARDLAGGFLTQSDYNAAVAAAEASPVP
jgi:hypothetical protein